MYIARAVHYQIVVFFVLLYVNFQEVDSCIINGPDKVIDCTDACMDIICSGLWQMYTEIGWRIECAASVPFELASLTVPEWVIKEKVGKTRSSHVIHST